MSQVPISITPLCTFALLHACSFSHDTCLWHQYFWHLLHKKTEKLPCLTLYMQNSKHDDTKMNNKLSALNLEVVLCLVSLTTAALSTAPLLGNLCLLILQCLKQDI